MNAPRAAGGPRALAAEPAPGKAGSARVAGSLAAALFFAALFVARVGLVFRREFDSDEPQHLHVVWAWTRGLLPYRDLFDNHMPLFHAAHAPLLAALGEHAQALFTMRLAMLPWFALTLLAIGWLGSALFSRRVGVWGTVIAALWPEHFLTALEFRPDVPWAALWLLGLAVLLGGRPTRARALGAGLLFGLALAVSLKTVVLLAALGLGALMVRLPLPGAVRSAPASGAPGGPARLALLLGATALVPGAVVAWFAARGALGPMLACTVGHQLAPGLGGPGARALILALALIPLAWLGDVVVRRAADPELGARRATLLLSSALALAGFESLWPFTTPQDFLPIEPVLALLVVALALEWRARAGRSAAPADPAAPRAGASRSAPRVALVAALALGELAALVARAPWRDGTRPAIEIVEAALRLTYPTDLVMDLKGETVFRMRPFYPVLESVTRRRLAAGQIPDRIPERLVETRTAVVANDSRFFPPRGRAFMDSNYVSVGPLRVLGMALGDPGPAGVLEFRIVIPERYSVRVAVGGSEEGFGAGTLDGRRPEGPTLLAAGLHRYRPAAGERGVLVVWARALESGYSPRPMPQSPPP